jgi:hypothetical protein
MVTVTPRTPNYDVAVCGGVPSSAGCSTSVWECSTYADNGGPGVAETIQIPKVSSGSSFYIIVDSRTAGTMGNFVIRTTSP